MLLSLGELIADACCDPDGWDECFAGLPWDWSADHRPGDALAACGDAGRAAIPALCAAVRTTDAISAAFVLDDLLDLALPEGFSGKLDDDGVAVVGALVEAEHLWEEPGQFVSALIQAGLWGGPLDSRADGAIRKHLRGLLERNRSD